MDVSMKTEINARRLLFEFLLSLVGIFALLKAELIGKRSRITTKVTTLEAN